MSMECISLQINSLLVAVVQLLSHEVVTAFLPRSKCLLISWLQSLSTVILDPRKRKSISASIFSPSICHEVMGPDAKC